MFYHQQESKVNHLGEKAKNSQKTSKIMTFCQNLTSVTSDFYALLELLLGARYFCPYDPRVENKDKLAFWVNLHFGGKKWLPRFEFGETFSSANFCQNSPPVVPTKKSTNIWDDQRSLRRPKKSKTKKFAILTPPPNLAKSTTHNVSRSKVSKGLLISVPKEGRMQNLSEIVWTVFEISTFWPLSFIPVINSLDRQGPYPGRTGFVSVEKHGHLGGRRGQEQVFALNQEFSTWYVPLECFESLLLFFYRYLAVPFGHSICSWHL